MSMSTATQTPAGFSVEQFNEQGFTGPVRIFSEAEAAALRGKFFAETGMDEAAPGETKHYMSAWHHRLKWAYDMSAHPKTLDLVEQLLGPDLVLWALHFWYKAPHHPSHIPWHQDGAYWPIRPVKNVTAWIALGATFKENGCLRVVPGTHRTMKEHAKVEAAHSAFGQGLKAEDIDESKAVDLEMQPGEVVIFNEGTFHGSNPNTSAVPRVACSCRFTTPEVEFLMDKWSDPGRIRTFLVRGEDRFGKNDAIRAAPPTA